MIFAGFWVKFVISCWIRVWLWRFGWSVALVKVIGSYQANGLEDGILSWENLTLERLKRSI